MGGFIQPSPVSDERDTNWRAILIGAVLIILVVGGLLLISRTESKRPAGPPPYANNLKITDLKMSAAENFVGATVSYIDGTVTNAGDKIVTHATVTVIFKDSLGQLAQREDVPLHVLQTSGPYPDVVDLSTAPLAPGQSKTFRLTFESISEQWNHEYPELRISDVTTK